MRRELRERIKENTRRILEAGICKSESKARALAHAETRCGAKTRSGVLVRPFVRHTRTRILDLLFFLAR